MDTRNALIAAASLALATAVMYLSTTVPLLERWSSDANTYAHGYLVAAISLIVLLRESSRVRAASNSRLQSAGLVLAIVGFGFIWLLAHLAVVQIVQALMLPAILFAALLLVFGWRSAAVWLFPVGFLYFAMPIWDYLNSLLQEATIVVVGGILRMLNIPALLDGSFVYLPVGTFEIAEGCSGLHFFVVALALASFYAYLYLPTIRQTAVLMVTAALFAVAMNWVRVAVIIVAGHASDMQHYLVTTDHYMFGWALFVVMMIPMYFAADYIETRLAAKGAASSTIHAPEPATRSAWGALVVAMVAMGIAPAIAAILDGKARASVWSPESLPVAMGDWRLAVLTRQWKVAFPGAATSDMVSYRQLGTDAVVDVFVSRYGLQTQGEELINSENSLYDVSAWSISSERMLDEGDQESGVTQVVVRQLTAKDGEEQLQFYWYVTGSETHSDPMAVKRAELSQRLKGSADSGIVALRVFCTQGCSTALQTGERFLRDNFDALTFRKAQR